MTQIDDTIKKSIEIIVDQIKNEKVIPVIGYDLLFNEFDDKGDRDFKRSASVKIDNKKRRIT